MFFINLCEDVVPFNYYTKKSKLIVLRFDKIYILQILQIFKKNAPQHPRKEKKDNIIVN